MAGEHLFAFDVELCEYALGQFRYHLLWLTARPASAARLDRREWAALDPSGWVGHEVEALPPGLADHLWKGVSADAVRGPLTGEERDSLEAGDRPRLPLTDRELDALADAAADPPPHLRAGCGWEPYPALHARYVGTVREVRDALTRRTAEEWADACAGFAARLSAADLPMADGVEVVREWVRTLRRLLRAMGADRFLPAPEGAQPTPTNPRPARRRREHLPVSGVTAAVVEAAPAPAMLTPARIATKYSVSRSTVYAACRAGVLPHYRVPARKGAKGKYLIKEVDLSAWLESLRSAGESPTSASAPASSRPAPAEPFSELNPERLRRAWETS